MGSAAKPFVDRKILSRAIVLFSKSENIHHDCELVKQILSEYHLPHEHYEIVNIEKRQDCTQIENYFQILCMTDTRQVPQLFVYGRYIGGVKEVCRLHKSGELTSILNIQTKSKSKVCFEQS